jgi:cytochrome P450
MTETLSALKPLSDAPEIDFSVGDDGPDSHAVLRDLRAMAPIARTPMGFVIALRHHHLDLVTSDATRQIETETKIMQGIFDGPIFEFISAVMLFANGDAHLRRRMPVSRAFAFKLMDAMRPVVRQMTEELITPHLDGAPVEFVSQFAAQLPARIIADLLGIPRSDLPVFMQWIADTAEAIGFINPERRPTIEASLVAFGAYVAELIQERRARPRADFITEYLANTANDGVLTEMEIQSQVLGLILAGSDTTRGSMGMTLAHLLTRKDQWSAFCADPDGLKKAVVDEGLRYDPVISGLPRIAVQDMEIDGYLVPAGTPVMVSMLSSLRDPAVYADPDTFNIRRTDHPRWHPVFGAGAHRCVGEALARAEMEEALATIARLAPNSELVGDFPTLAPGGIRQISPLSVAFRR